MPKGKMLKNHEGKCIMCDTDISHKRITALYCDKCKKISLRRMYRESKRVKRKYYASRKCKSCDKTIKRTEELKYWNGYCESCK